MAAARRRNSVANCPLTAALAAVGGKWKLIIVYWLCESPRHFAALRRLIPGLSQKVLAEQLSALVADGIVARRPTGGVPSPVVYSLTGYGRSLEPLLAEVLSWGRGHVIRLQRSALAERAAAGRAGPEGEEGAGSDSLSRSDQTRRREGSHARRDHAQVFSSSRV